MSTFSLVFGILALIGMFVAFFPCLGWMNWFNIPFAVVGLVLGVIAVANQDKPRGPAVAGIVACCAAIGFGLIRLAIGGGVL